MFYCDMIRCSQPTAASNALFLDPDNQGNGQIADIDECFHQKAYKHVSSESTEAMETIKHKKEEIGKVPSKANPILDAESSLGDQIQHGSSPSYRDSSDASKGGVDIDSEKPQKPVKRSSSNLITELREPITSDYGRSRDSESNDSKTEPRDCKDDSRNQSPFHEKRNHCSGARLCSVAELKTRIDDGVASSMSDRKGWYDGDHLTVSHGRRKDRHHGYGFYNGEDLSYYRETEISIGYHSRRLIDKHNRKACTEILHGKDQRHFRDEIYPYRRRDWDEKKYFLEQRGTVEDNEMNQSRRYLRQRDHTNESVSELAYEESTRTISEHSSFNTYKEKHLWQRSKRDDECYEHRFRKRNEDDFVPEHRYTEEFIQDKYGMPYNGRRESFEEKYESHALYNEREIKTSGRRERYGDSPHLNLDSSWRSVQRDDEYWRHPDDQSLSPHSYRESDIANGKEWIDTSSPQNDMYNSRRLDERYVDHWKKISSEKYRDRDWFYPNCKDDYDYDYDYDADDRASYFDDQVCDNRRRFRRQSEVLHWAEDELSSRHQDRDDLYAKEADFSYERSLRRDFIYIKHESAHGGVVSDDKRLERDRNKMTREESRNSEASNHRSSSFDIHRGGKHEQATLRCRDSIDLHLVGWGGKPSGGWSNARDVRSDGRRDNSDQVIDKSYTGMAISPHISKVDCNHIRSVSSKIEKVGQCDSKLSTEQSEKWLDKYPVTQHNEDSGLEEGQLPVEEPEKIEVGLIDKKQVSVNKALVGNITDRRLAIEDAANKHKVVGGIDNHRILETLAKMEKRRERFKEPITLKGTVENTNPQPEPVVEMTEVKQQRPARKRRWGGN